MLIADYETLRTSLIDEDRSLRREFLRTHLYSDKEKEADKILRAIRASEAATIWNEEHPSIPHPFPGMEFLTGMWDFKKKSYFNLQYHYVGKRIIMKTKVFEILSKACRSLLLLFIDDPLMNI